MRSLVKIVDKLVDWVDFPFSNLLYDNDLIDTSQCNHKNTFGFLLVLHTIKASCVDITFLPLSVEQRTDIFSQINWDLPVLPPRIHHTRACKIWCDMMVIFSCWVQFSIENPNLESKNSYIQRVYKILEKSYKSIWNGSWFTSGHSNQLLSVKEPYLSLSSGTGYNGYFVSVVFVDYKKTRKPTFIVFAFPTQLLTNLFPHSHPC